MHNILLVRCVAPAPHPRMVAPKLKRNQLVKQECHDLGARKYVHPNLMSPRSYASFKNPIPFVEYHLDNLCAFQRM